MPGGLSLVPCKRGGRQPRTRLEPETLSKPGPCPPWRARFLWVLLTPPFLTRGSGSSCFLQKRAYPVIMGLNPERLPVNRSHVVPGVLPRPRSFSLGSSKYCALWQVKGIRCPAGESPRLGREPGCVGSRRNRYERGAGWPP